MDNDVNIPIYLSNRHKQYCMNYVASGGDHVKAAKDAGIDVQEKLQRPIDEVK